MPTFQIRTDLPFEYNATNANWNNFKNKYPVQKSTFLYLTSTDSVRNTDNPPSTIVPGDKDSFRLDLQASRSDAKLYSIQQNGVGNGHNFGNLVFEFYSNGVPNTDNHRRDLMINEIVLQKHWDDNKDQVSVTKKIK